MFSFVFYCLSARGTIQIANNLNIFGVSSQPTHRLTDWHELQSLVSTHAKPLNESCEKHAAETIAEGTLPNPPPKRARAMGRTSLGGHDHRVNAATKWVPLNRITQDSTGHNRSQPLSKQLKMTPTDRESKATTFKSERSLAGKRTLSTLGRALKVPDRQPRGYNTIALLLGYSVR